MSAEVARLGWIGRLAGWLGRLFDRRPSVSNSSAEPAKPHVFQALLFRPTGETLRPNFAELVDRARARMLSSRLKSVAAQNVPRSLAPKRRKIEAPRGKAIPKKAPRVLKSYRRQAPIETVSARARILKLTSLRPKNVIDLVRDLKAWRSEQQQTSRQAA